MIGVALVTFITVLAASAKSSTTARLDRTLTADYVVDSGAFEQGGFSPVLAGRVGLAGRGRRSVTVAFHVIPNRRDVGE